MDDPNSVEVDEQMQKCPFLVIRLEECAIPVDTVETHKTPCWWNIDKTSLTKGDQHIDPCHKRLTYLVCEHNVSNSLWIPEQLVHITVTNAIMTTFSLHKLSINGLIALITNEAVKGLNNCTKVEAFWDGIDAILAIRRAVIVIRAFEDKAEARGNESDLR